MAESGHLLADPRALLAYETDPLVCERLRLLAADAGWHTCVVDSVRLFFELQARIGFPRLVAGARDPEALEELKLGPELEPLALLVPLDAPGAAVHYRIAASDALLLDRRLRNPRALLDWLDARPPREPLAEPDADPVRRAFEPFALSERQLEVLHGALRGESSAELGARLFISQLTVRNHLHAIYERVGVSGRRELLGRFVRGLLDAP